MAHTTLRLVIMKIKKSLPDHVITEGKMFCAKKINENFSEHRVTVCVCVCGN
jgi:hypothetical protein